MYAIKEAFYTLQGEGYHTGTPAVFLRFTGCNMWSGHEKDRERDAGKGGCSRWCDTDFLGTDGTNGGVYNAVDLAALTNRIWPGYVGRKVVLTGGEPALQVDVAIIDALHGYGFSIHIETNGTVALPPNLDWITVSPKPPSEPLIQRYDEVKIVSDGNEDVERWRKLAPHGFVQPRWESDPAWWYANMARCAEYVMRRPGWRLSVQMHKMTGIP